LKTVTREFVEELIDFAPDEATRRRGFAESQLEGTVALFNMLTRNRVAYLADEVGMGKTYVALGVMSLLRHLEPNARVLVIAPRENIQLKWVKELGNFVHNNWKLIGNRVKSLQGGPAWEPVVCSRLLDLTHEAALHEDRDFFLRMTSFSVALNDSAARSRLRKGIRRQLPWLNVPALSSPRLEEFRDGFGVALNAALPEADLVIVDEGHNLKHGFGERGSIRNRLMGLAFGHEAGRPLAGDWYGHRAKRLLLLSATPFEEDYAALQKQLDVFGFGRARLSDADGADPLSVARLASREVGEDEKREVVRRLMVRRTSSLRIAGDRYTKNTYRREWGEGGYAMHDQPIERTEPRQRLSVALMQKKVAEVLADERFGRSFQIGMLSSFESFLESLGRNRRLAAKLQPEVPEGEECERDAAFDGRQTEQAEERRGIDTDAIEHVASSYRERFQAPLPNPKLDATADSLSEAFATGEKTLVFVRRVRTVDELGAKLDRHFDAWIRKRMDAALPHLSGDIAELFERYEGERGTAMPELAQRAIDMEEPAELLEDRRIVAEEDEGGSETFFSWFFRGAGPPEVLSGASFQKRRLSGQSSAYSTLFEEDFVAWLLARLDDPISALVEITGSSVEHTRNELRRLAFGAFQERTSRAAGYPRFLVYEAYQIAGLTLIEQVSEELGQRARTVLDERFAGVTAHALEPPPGFPEPERGLGFTSVITELAKRPQLRAELWPEEPRETFRDQLRRSEQRRELFSGIARLGGAYIDLYLLAIEGLGSFAQGSEGAADEGEAGTPAEQLARDFVALLERQRGEPGFHAYYELSQAAAQFDLLLAVNFPEASAVRLHELPSLYSATLQRQVPVGRMAGSVNKRLVRQFRMPGFPLLLATTDVLQEGEDLHTFCRNVVHYGITWTPSAMEQRTGRIDRIGGLVQRALDGSQRVPEPDELIQVYFPHLVDTVEVLQVRRVLQRMNRFLRLIHETGEHPEDVSSRIDTEREMLAELEALEPLAGPLESAFPVREAWLRGELGPDDVVRPDVASLVSHLEQLWHAAQREWEIRPEHTTVRNRWEGTARTHGLELARQSSRGGLETRFQLELHSQAAGDATLLHCHCVAGDLDLDDDNALDALYALQTKLRGARVCVEPRARTNDDLITVENDILFHPHTTQLDELASLIGRTAGAAALLHRDLIALREKAPRRRRKRRERR
jgi:superfamily II DNA or RNA helicase